MHRSRLPLFATLLLCLAPGLGAQAARDPSGHWEGVLQAQGKEARFEVDLARNRAGGFEGTLSEPANNMRGLPLLQVIVEGSTVSFSARADQPFHGVLSEDGKSLAGELAIGGMSIPVTLTRTGEPRIDPPARIAQVGKEFEGTWNGTLDAKGTTLRLVLTVANHPDGTATASITNLDQGNVTVPASAITQAASTLTIELRIIAGSYAGVLNKDGTELAGTFAQGPLSAPLTFRRVPAEGRK